LHLEDIGERRVERLLPARRRRAGFADLDELRRDLHAVGAGALLPADRRRQQVVGVELLRDLPRRLLSLLVRHRARTGNDLEARQRRELAAERVGDAVGEVVVLGRAEVVEREDRDAADRGLRGRRRGGGRGRRRRYRRRRPAPEQERGDDEEGDEGRDGQNSL